VELGHYLYLVIDVWSRKVVAWDVAEVESAQIAADLVQRACLKERYHRPSSFGSRQPRPAASREAASTAVMQRWAGRLASSCPWGDRSTSYPPPPPPISPCNLLG